MSYRMPAEWEPHEATWLSWPHNPETWPGRFDPVPAVFAEIVASLCDGEEVRILAGDGALEASARRVLAERGVDERTVRFLRIPTNDCWARDHGPIFVFDDDDRLVITDWIFNSWGGKYGPWDLDDVVPTRIGKELDTPVRRLDVVLEGGSIDPNGRGTFLTTTSCLLNPNRNPRLDRTAIERLLEENLGATNVLWLGEGIVGDDTDGHIDDLTRFVAPSTVVTVIEHDSADPNYKPLLENLRALHGMRDENGKALEIATLPMPGGVYLDEQRLPASYANFYIGNRAVLVPVFGDPRDDEACETLARLFPDRRIVPIHCTDLVWGLGAIHCVTQQQPARRGKSG